MLAKFIDRTVPENKSHQGRRLIDGNQPAKISDQMRDIGGELIGQSDYVAALEACKQALSPIQKIIMPPISHPVAATYLGRSGEHEKVFVDALKNSSDPYFKNLGYVQSDSRATPISDRVKSLEPIGNRRRKMKSMRSSYGARLEPFFPSR